MSQDFFARCSKISPDPTSPSPGTNTDLTLWKSQGTIGCTPNSVPIVFIVFSRDSWGLYII